MLEVLVEITLDLTLLTPVLIDTNEISLLSILEGLIDAQSKYLGT